MLSAWLPIYPSLFLSSSAHAYHQPAAGARTDFTFSLSIINLDWSHHLHHPIHPTRHFGPRTEKNLGLIFLRSFFGAMQLLQNSFLSVGSPFYSFYIKYMYCAEYDSIGQSVTSLVLGSPVTGIVFGFSLQLPALSLVFALS